MNVVSAKTCHIREINPQSQAEIELVASRMRLTLIDVMGEQRGTSLYSMEQLLERLKWHLDPKNTTARVYLAENDARQITGHAIVRIEYDADGKPFGYFSTIYVEPATRRQGVATRLLCQVEAWVLEHGLPKIVYNTAHNNTKLLDLFHKHDFRVTLKEGEMVQLTKTLTS